MAVSLRTALSESMDGWEETLPSAWKPVFESVTLDKEAIPADVKHDRWVPIFPTIYGSRDKDTRILGAPKDAHAFRALQNVTPSKVRVVIVGQDPYPDVAKATGVSFEQGNLGGWLEDGHRVASSLRAVLQSAAAAHTGNDDYRSAQGWSAVLRDLESGAIALARPKDLFSECGRQGILWMNTTLTISLFKSSDNHQKAHAAFWKPFIEALFQHLVSRPSSKHVVFDLWGGWAKSFKTPILKMAQEASNLENVAFVEDWHPVTPTFLQGNNPLVDTNQALTDFGGPPVEWLPD